MEDNNGSSRHKPYSGQRSFPEGSVEGFCWIIDVLQDLQAFASAKGNAHLAGVIQDCSRNVESVLEEVCKDRQNADEPRVTGGDNVKPIR